MVDLSSWQLSVSKSNLLVFGVSRRLSFQNLGYILSDWVKSQEQQTLVIYCHFYCHALLPDILTYTCSTFETINDSPYSNEKKSSFKKTFFKLMNSNSTQDLVDFGWLYPPFLRSVHKWRHAFQAFVILSKNPFSRDVIYAWTLTIEIFF